MHAASARLRVKFDLFLYRTVEWKIAAFFRSIGQKKHGEKLAMDWNKVIGAKGRCHVKQRDYTNNNGEERTVNDIDKFYDYNPDDHKLSVDDLVPVDFDDNPFDD